MFEQSVENFAALRAAVEREGVKQHPEQALEVLNRCFVNLIEEWHLLPPNEQAEQSVRLLEAQANFHFVGNLYITMIYNSDEAMVEEEIEISLVETESASPNTEESSLLAEPMEEQQQEQQLPEQMPRLVPMEKALLEQQHQEQQLLEQQQQQLLEQQQQQLLEQQQQERQLPKQQPQELKLPAQQQQLNEPPNEPEQQQSPSEQNRMIEASTFASTNRSMGIEVDQVPDISTLSFSDHIRVLHPIYSLRPIGQLAEHKILEIIISIQEVNIRARELGVSIASQHRALLAFMHGLLDITSQQLWMWQAIEREPNWDDFVHFLVRRSHTIDPAELPRRASTIEPRAAVRQPSRGPSRDQSPVPSTSRASSIDQCVKCKGHRH